MTATLFWLSAALALSVAGPARGEAMPWLLDRDIESTLAGKTIEGRYADGKAFTESYLPDGRIEYLEGSKKIGGRWSVTAGTLCTIYDVDPTGGCYRVTRVGPNCFEFYFASRTEIAAPGPQGSTPSWTARGSVSGERAACEDNANV